MFNSIGSSLYWSHRPSAQLDGELITSLNVQEYRKQIALVSQEPTLYAGTIRFNILLGAIKPTSEVTQEEIEAACQDANIFDFINSLPEYVHSVRSVVMYLPTCQWL